MEYLWLGMLVVSVSTSAAGFVVFAIARDKAKKKLEDRVDALEKKVATLEMWSDYGIQTED